MLSDSSSLFWFGLTRVQLSHRLQSIADDLRQGTPSVCSATVEIENWALARRTVPCLIGVPKGHPTVEDGRTLFSSELFYLDAEAGLGRSFSRWYRLGKRVPPEYWNARYPVKQ